MNQQPVELSQKINDLLGVLERDVEHVGRTAMQLDELRGFVIKRDEQGLNRLLEEIRAEEQDYSANEQNRKVLREQLAGLLGCKTQELTLSVLETRVSEPQKTTIAESRKRLRALVENLQREYVSTVALLSDCSRINSLLLKIIFEQGRNGLVCYDSDGTPVRKSDAAFMSMRI
jgi:uncharacterized coiled-coil protein SlyX